MILLLIIFIIIIQTLLGYIQNVWLGSILPIISIILSIYVFINGMLDLRILDLLMPFVGLFGLIGAWSYGYDLKQKRL